MRPLNNALDRLLGAPVWAWAALALLLRLAFTLKLGSRFYQLDEMGFDAPAWNLALNGVIGQGARAAVVPPVPAAFFGAVYALFGHDMLYPRLAQAFLGTATAWCLGRMTAELTGSQRAGRLALAVSAVYPFFIYYNGILMAETLYLFFLVPGLWWLSSAREAVAWRPAAAGCCLALAGLCRVEGVFIAGLIWAAAFPACLLGRRRWRDFVLALLCWSLPLLGWAQRNRLLTGEFTLDSHGGVTLLHGTMVYEIDQSKATAEAMKALEAMPFYAAVQDLSPAERDRAYRKAALDFMLANPGATLRQWGRKLVSFWRFYPRTDNAYYESAHSKPGAGLGRAALVAISLLFEPWLILGGLAGLWSLRRRWAELYPLGLFLLGTMGVHVLVVSMMRYRLPIMPLLIFGFCSLAAGEPDQSAKR